MIAQKMPKIALIAIALGILTFNHPCASIAKNESKKSSKGSAAVQQATRTGSDQEAVQAQLARLGKTLAQGDAKELATLWAEDGNYIDSDGAICKGKAALEKRFAEVFATEGKQFVDLQNDSLKLLSPNVAVAEGVVRRKDAPEGPTPETRYSIVFLKQNANWLISSATETPLSAETANPEPLNELSWLIGEWSSEQNGGYVKMKAEWAANKNFITCRYETKKSADAPLMESRQVIGWDPRSGEPISWHFDSNGGFGWGNWIKKDREWLVEASGVDRDGSTTSATNVISQTDTDNFSWQSVNRSVDGVAFNDSNPLKVHRVVK